MGAMRSWVSWGAKCLAAMAMMPALGGCRSPWIQCTIVNHETRPVSLVEVNYPGGSFGVDAIAAGAKYVYRFHALSTDTVSLDFTDAARQQHTAKGPELQQGQEGTLTVEIEPDGRVQWAPKLTPR
jgi:hypothetical protein